MVLSCAALQSNWGGFTRCIHMAISNPGPRTAEQSSETSAYSHQYAGCKILSQLSNSETAHTRCLGYPDRSVTTPPNAQFVTPASWHLQRTCQLVGGRSSATTQGLSTQLLQYPDSIDTSMALMLVRKSCSSQSCIPQSCIVQSCVTQSCISQSQMQQLLSSKP